MTVLFDLDGTLTDPAEGILGSVAYALRKMGIQPPPHEEMRWLIGPPLQGSLARILQTKDEARLAECLALYRERFGEIGLFENELYEGVPEMLGELRRGGHRLFLATSKPAVFASRILAHFEIAGFFEGTYGSELDGTRTDKGELIAYLLDREALEARETVMVGDRRHDVEGAKANGIPCIGVLYGYGSEEELRSAGAHALADTPAAVPTTLSPLLSAQ
ncbi:MAG TPA: HAD family hydrolase [Fimbriimonadaceae bacterium]|nr:HAD family hydrolase [Fimbriimonadaceae bacterium]